MSFRTHPNYQRLIERARSSHAAGRSTAGISDDDILLARLYCYAWRGHVIGTFHATQLAIDARAAAIPADAAARAKALLADLASVSLDPIADDFRAVISTFHRYDTLIRRTLGEMDALVRQDQEMQTVRARFLAQVERIAQSGGIACTRDDEVPAQSSFIVPNLGITIVPLVYGDHHSWNVAFLAGESANVPRHQHQQGVEIHLGMGKLHGDTLLGHQRCEVTEGYAMAIPPRTPHGFANTSGHDHYLPFVFGSRLMGGWGVFLDVEPQPIELEALERVERSENCLNGLVYLDRQIELAAKSAETARWTLVGPHATFRPESGGARAGHRRRGRRRPDVAGGRLSGRVGGARLRGGADRLLPTEGFGPRSLRRSRGSRRKLATDRTRVPGHTGRRAGDRTAHSATGGHSRRLTM